MTDRQIRREKITEDISTKLQMHKDRGREASRQSNRVTWTYEQRKSDANRHRGKAEVIERERGIDR